MCGHCLKRAADERVHRGTELERPASTTNDTSMRLKDFSVVAVVAAALITAFALFNYPKFEADGSISPRTAVQLGLLDELEAPFSAAIKFKKSEAGGYDYRVAGVTSNTAIDLMGECQRLGGCKINIRPAGP